MPHKFIEQLSNYKLIDFRFTDLYGTWHHITLPTIEVNAALLKEGLPFDGSSIAGWKAVNDSDMLLIPDIHRPIVVDPFASNDTAVVFCDVVDPVTHLPYSRDPRSIAKKAEAYLKASGIADRAFFGSEAEFFIFDAVKFHEGSDSSYYHIYSDELPYANAKEPNNGYRPQHKGGYMPCGPVDSLSDIRAEMMLMMEEMGLVTEKHHHEVAAAQHEIGIRFGSLVEMADAMQIYKFVVHSVAHSYGKTATFLPKPICGDNGSGMHVHQSLWMGDQPLFAGNGYAGLSQEALYYIGGILKHAKSLNAFTNPTTNSYKRLVPGFEAPVICAYSARNRSASCRIPTSGTSSPKTKRIEVRFPDPTANSYLSFAAMLLAGLDGIKHKIDPGAAAEGNLFEDHNHHYPSVCGSLREALNSLEKDHEFLCQGSVFTQEFIKAYIELKWKEVYAYEQAPHPIEFKMYYAL